jgi:peroxiredoxin Q/BCP
VQATGLRDRARSLQATGVVLLGITFSPMDELRAWRDELGLGTDLLSDTERRVALAYGAATDPTQDKATRLSVLIGADGVVVRSYEKVDPARHADEVLRDLATLG